MPDVVELRNVRCEFDVYKTVGEWGDKIPTSQSDCEGLWFREYFLANTMPSLENDSDGFVNRAKGLNENNTSVLYSAGKCSFDVKGFGCQDISFINRAEDVYFVDSSGTQITSTQGSVTKYTTIPEMTSVNIICGTGNTAKKIPYSFENSTPYFYPNTSRLEFIPKNDANLGCQYHDGDNYLAFACSEDNTSVEAVQYKCGL